ncbi:MAG: tyrosine-type recombinase/integrase [Chroococcidiopsidaceae cyanobacterium CP_BM_ER_R8_30]|nr:tyrosine-type recombinase/integrase [Chroococcidiopsidaceae cyanobacterium CP_BM_ER_R8_30]
MSITLANLATQFLERPGLSQSTIRSYESAMIPLLQQYGQVPIDSLDRQILKQYLNSLTHLLYTTHNRHQTIIQSLFNFAVEQGYLVANPLAKLKRRQPCLAKGEHNTAEAIRYLTSQQLQILYSLVEQNSRLHTLILLLHRTGAKVSEVLALDLEQVDFIGRKFLVIGNGNKQRWCFYSEDMTQVLEKYLKLYRHPGHPALFTAQHPFTLKVTRLSYRTAHDDWTNLVQQSPELAKARLYDLRHTFAMERVGLMGIEELQTLMGHTSIQTTLRYQKVISIRAEEVARKALHTLTIT